MIRNSMIRPVAAAFVLSVVAVQLNAQSIIRMNPGTDATVARLHREAAALYEKPTSYATAAGMLKRAADLQSLDELQRVRDRTLAARLWFYAGDRTLARNTMKQAAGEALGLGEVLQAANLYTDACFIAIEQQDASTARELYDAAARLSRSKVLAAVDRAQLDTRLGLAAQKLASR